SVEGFVDENNQDPTVLSFQNKDENFDHLTGKTITKDEATELAKTHTNIKNVKNVIVTENGKGAAYDFYSINFDDGNGQGVSVDITKKGGYPVWFINHREVGEQEISLNDAVLKAEQFLKKNKYEKLVLADSVQYDSIGLLTFITKQDD